MTTHACLTSRSPAWLSVVKGAPQSVPEPVTEAVVSVVVQRYLGTGEKSSGEGSHASFLLMVEHNLFFYEERISFVCSFYVPGAR